ncbi:MAG: hypothetical protein FJZ47_12515 [Candidatus Tectomicrobia bacterium]|uniref:Uncharacterized protein n=1 Tax=Tectimicrobiota bacterium TaxID=2528274 RepID=A0A938B4E8_UNCTE|nr:hypothetical protein [Candidatus Tectomicrobia bacterium]
MSQGLRDIQTYDVATELERILVPRLAERLHHRGPGHCMRVTDLEVDLMVRVCGRLRAEVPGANVVVLSNGTTPGIPVQVAVTSTKLVELRNPLADGTLRPPLLVFVPNDVRAAAEDSFGIATFEDVQVGNVYHDLREQLLREVPASLRGVLGACLQRLETGETPWPFADPVAMGRFLLTGKLNDHDPAAYGAAIYELGLIPDFELLQDPARAPQRLVRNRDSVATLTWSSKSERGRVLDLHLRQRAFRQQLGNFLSEAGLEDPRVWTRRIVLDRSLWPLAFHRWEFEDGGQEPDAIYIGAVTTDLPTVPDDVEDDKLGQLVGQQILPLKGGGPQKFSVRFRVDPQPSRVQGLAKFVLQVCSQERGPVGLVRNKSVWKTASQQTSVSFTKLNKVAWEEGWHYVRVLAQSADGNLVPLVDEAGQPLPWAPEENDLPAIPPNTSDLFYVLPEDDVDIEPIQRAIPRESSVSHAALRLQFTALQEGRALEAMAPTTVKWAERRPRGRVVGTDMLEAQFPREGTYQVPISHALKLVEHKILADANGPLYWRIPLALGVAGPSTGEVTQWPQTPATQSFLTARRQYFDVVRGGIKELITQGVDFRSARDAIMAYASAYLSLLQELGHRVEVSDTFEAQLAFADLRHMLALDSVFLTVTDHRERRREATLIAPTHPLRALWLATWAALGQTWLAELHTAPKEFVGPTREALLRQLAPVAFPPVLPTETGHILIAVDNLNPFWALYAPSPG